MRSPDPVDDRVAVADHPVGDLATGDDEHVRSGDIVERGGNVEAEQSVLVGDDAATRAAQTTTSAPGR